MVIEPPILVTQLFSKLDKGNQNIHVVADLINSSSHSWKFDTVRSLYQQPTCNEILHIPLPNTEGGRDKVLWKHSISGEFPVNKAYELPHKNFMADNLTGTRQLDIHSSVWSVLLKVKLPLKILTFIWKLLHDCIFPLKLPISAKSWWVVGLQDVFWKTKSWIRRTSTPYKLYLQPYGQSGITETRSYMKVNALIPLR